MAEIPTGLADGLDEKKTEDSTLVLALESGMVSQLMAPKDMCNLISKPVNMLSSMAKETC